MKLSYELTLCGLNMIKSLFVILTLLFSINTFANEKSIDGRSDERRLSKIRDSCASSAKKKI